MFSNCNIIAGLGDVKPAFLMGGKEAIAEMTSPGPHSRSSQSKPRIPRASVNPLRVVEFLPAPQYVPDSKLQGETTTWEKILDAHRGFELVWKKQKLFGEKRILPQLNTYSAFSSFTFLCILDLLINFFLNCFSFTSFTCFLTHYFSTSFC